jgi:hypothetical protein
VITSAKGTGLTCLLLDLVRQPGSLSNSFASVIRILPRKSAAVKGFRNQKQKRTPEGRLRPIQTAGRADFTRSILTALHRKSAGRPNSVTGCQPTERFLADRL